MIFFWVSTPKNLGGGYPSYIQAVAACLSHHHTRYVLLIVVRYVLINHFRALKFWLLDLLNQLLDLIGEPELDSLFCSGVFLVCF